MSASGEEAPAKLTDDFFNKMGISYEEAFGDNDGLINVLDRFLTLLPEDALVLDCGSGTGKPAAEMVVSSGRRVLGIDFSQTMVDISQKQVPGGHFERHDMLEYSPQDKTFGGIIVAFSLFLLNRSEITAMVRKWYEWLAPQGHLLIVAIGAEDCNAKPEMYDADGLFANRIPWTFMGQKEEFGLFTKAGWCRVLEDAGFQIIFTQVEAFQPRGPLACDEEEQYFVIAKK